MQTSMKAIMDAALIQTFSAIVGAAFTRGADESRQRYGVDALQIGHDADLVLLPASTHEIVAIAQVCNTHRIPLVVRGAGTGYTGGAVPVHGGVVVSMERLNRILEIDEDNLL